MVQWRQRGPALPLPWSMDRKVAQGWVLVICSAPSDRPLQRRPTSVSAGRP